MSDEGPSQRDRDLLARLNALKKSSVVLDEKKCVSTFDHVLSRRVSRIDSTDRYSVLPTTLYDTALEPLPGRDLHADLTARFKSLRSGPSAVNSTFVKTGTQTHELALQTQDDDKTVEDLLAELGPEEDWNVKRDDEREIEDLLRQAQISLKTEPLISQDVPVEEEDEGQKSVNEPPCTLPPVDVSAFQPEAESDEEIRQQTQSKDELRKSVDNEAEEFLQQILDEIQHEASSGGICAPPGEQGHEDEKPATLSAHPPGQSDKESTPEGDLASLPSTPSKDPVASEPPQPSPTARDTTRSTSKPKPPPTAADLKARFSNLSTKIASASTSSSPLSPALTLPSIPTKDPATSSTTSSSRPPRTSSSYDDADVATWCCICNDDAALRCLGCEGVDGDEGEGGGELYCTRCWIEGHRGEDAGREERAHRAVLFKKEAGKRKNRRVGVGAV